jgi:outer membrane protein assembly factor BamA
MCVAVGCAGLFLAAATAHAFISLSENVKLVPLPEVITSPNEGTTVGFLPVVLVTNEMQQIRSIVAPDVRYNSITGLYPTFRLFHYPSDRQKLLLQAGKATTIGEYFEIRYIGEDLWDGWLDVQGRAFHENDPFERFFGFGNDTPESDETNYTGDMSILLASIGINLPYSLQVATQMRARIGRVRAGGVDDVPQLTAEERFAETPGLEPTTIVGQRFGLRYDSRDYTDIPSEGNLAEAALEVIDKALGSSTSYIKYSLEGRSFLPLRPDKAFILAAQAALDYIQGGERAPFYERSSLGGVRSLRGFGTNRFIDKHRFFMRGELRSNVWEPQFLADRFNVRGHLEAAPFVELGRVFHSSRTFPLEDPHVVGGLGLRAVVRPQVVAFVDFGSDGGSPVVFTGIDYPF